MIFLSLLTGRVLTNFVDVLGLLAIGLLGAMLASGLNNRPSAQFLGVSIEISSSLTYFWVVIGIAGLFFGKSALSTVLLRLTSYFMARLEGNVSQEIAEYIFSSNLTRLKEFSRGDIHFSVTGSTSVAVGGMLMSGASIASEGALFLFVFGVFLFVDSWTALLITLYFLTLVILFQVFVSKRLKRLGLRLKDSSIGVTNSLQDLTTSFREIFVFARQPFYIGRFADHRKQYSKDIALQSFLSALPRFFVESGLMLGVLALIGWQFVQDNLSDGLVTTAVFLAGGVRMMGALLPLQGAIANIRSFGPQAEPAQELLERARESQSPPASRTSRVEDLTASGWVSQSLGCEINIRKVDFTHRGNDQPTLADINVTVDSGSFIALVGPSGSGKTTLADLILGVLSPDSGEILVDGIKPGDLRFVEPGRIAYVPQSPGLVAGTIRENVALGVPPDKIDDAEVLRALEMAELNGLVSELPEGIYTDLGKQTDSLSGGQKQRMGLARALYWRPRLLVLDEATSALDAGTEATISETIRELGNETTVIVIAHRLSTIQRADYVHVVEDGRITASGTFKEVRKSAPIIEEYVKLMSFD